MRTKLVPLLLTLLMALTAPISMALAQDEPSVDELLADAEEQLMQTESMNFVMQIEGTTHVDEADTIQLTGAEGVMQRPDKVDVQFTAVFLEGPQISIRMVTIGDEAWITDIVTGKWVTSPPEFGYNPSVLYDEQDGLGPVMSRMNDPEITGSEEIDGRDTWHVTATVDGNVIERMTAGTMSGSEIVLEIWIDKETNNILQIRIAEPTDEDIEDPATWTLILSNHNEDVTIEQPVD